MLKFAQQVAVLEVTANVRCLHLDTLWELRALDCSVGPPLASTAVEALAVVLRTVLIAAETQGSGPGGWSTCYSQQYRKQRISLQYLSVAVADQVPLWVFLEAVEILS